MKNITLIAVVIFFATFAGVLSFGFIFSDNAIVNNNQVLSLPRNTPPIPPNLTNNINSNVNTNYNSNYSNSNLNTNVNTNVNTNTNLNQNTNNNATALTRAVVARHATANDCYLIINNKVYNVTSYIGQHPGGVRNITSYCGQEATGIFAAIHSNFAWDLLSQYYIGMLQ